MSDPRLPIENLAEARFECVYPTCGGICCQNGRPSVERREVERIEEMLPRIAPLLTPGAQERIEGTGFLTGRKKEGLPTLAVIDGWCVFFNQGCVLHKLGAAEGDRFRYKPWRCSVFPLERHPRSGAWHVRQQGVKGEAWELFCLDPQESPKLAADTLSGEIAFARELEHGNERERRG